MNEILNGWWQGILLTAIVWIILRDLPRVSAATRLAIWQVTLAVVLLLPVIQLIPMPREVVRTEAKRQQESVKAIPETVSAARQAPVIEVPEENAFPILASLAALLAILQLLRLAVGYWAVRRLKGKSQASGISLPSVLTRDAQIRISERVGMPMAIGYFHPVILLPKRLVESLSPEQLNQVLLHESAHLERNDDWVTLFERFIRAIFFFQPAVYWIGRQIDREREMATDDWVVAQSGHTKPYAEALARVAEFGSTGSAPILATGVGRRREIFRRMEALLDSTRSKIPYVSGPLVIAASLLMVFLVVQAAPFSHLLGFSEYQSRSVIKNGSFRREFKHRGEIHFNASEDDVESMGPGAKLAIVRTESWKSHSIEIESDDEGRVERRYFVGGVAQPYSTDAKRLLNRELPQWLKDSDINLPERLSRWVQAEGIEGAIRKIRSTLNNGIKRRYIEELIAAHKVDASQFRALLRIAEEIGSDDEKRRLFETVRDEALTLGLEPALLDLINSIHSDHDREHLLKSLLPEVSAGSLPNLFRSIDGIHADGTRAAILREAVKEIHQPLPVAFFTSAAGVHSSGDRKEVLLAALEHHGNEASTVQAVAKVAESISDDGDKAEVLAATASNFIDQQAIRQEFFAATKSIHSTGDRSRVLKSLLRRRDLSPETILAMSRMAEEMPQGDDQLVILRELKLR
jgi:beta-lactamase regulating signal transducer with metallopeptidase domain